VFIVGGLIYYGMREDDSDPLQDRLAELGDRTLPQSLE